MASKHNAQGGPSAAAAATPTMLYQSARTRIYRQPLDDGTSILCKEPQGPDAYARRQHEHHILNRLTGVAGVPQLSEGDFPQHLLALSEFGGVSLKQLLLHERLSLAAILQLGLELCAILDALYQHGIVHRDLNPDHILLSGPQRKAILIDFSLAMLPLAAAGDHATLEVHSDPAYLAPELASFGPYHADHRSDLYALGVILFELVVGHPPFVQTDLLQLVHEQMTGTPPVPMVLEPETPPMLSDLILRLLQKDPERRYQSAAGLAHDLRCIASTLGDAGAPGFTLGQRDFPLRLPAPVQLCGRHHELSLLRTAFEQAMDQQLRALLVCGGAGVGKKRLVAQLRPLVSARHGYFVSGQFDPVRQDLPSDGLLNAFRALALLLLAEPEEQLAGIRASALRALGPHAAILAALAPELSLLLDTEPAPLPIKTDNTDWVLGASVALLRAIAGPARPVVLVLDGMQWASPLALAVLDFIMLEPDLRGLMLVTTWRDDALVADAPPRLIQAKWQSHGASTLHLANLSPHGISELLQQMLRLAPEPAATLAAALHTQTDGNPDDTIALVNALRNDGVLTLGEHDWHWDPAVLKRYVGQHSAASLLGTRIARLPEASQSLLKIMACLGGEVDLTLLRLAAGTRDAPGSMELAPAIDDGLLAISADGQVLRFCHERVRQATYQGIAVAQRDALHLAMARRLALRAETSAIAAAQYLNVSALLEGSERQQVIRLFQQVAEQTSRNNLLASDQYLQAALALLGDAASGDDLQLVLALQGRRHDTLIRLHNTAEADAIYAVLEASSLPMLERIPMVCRQIASLLLRQQLAQALALGLRWLERLDYPLAPSTSEAELLSDLQDFERWIRQQTDAPPPYPEALSEPHKLAIAAILERCAPVAFFIDQALLARIGLAAWRLWRSDGPCAALIVPLSYIGMVAIHSSKNYRLGYATAHFLLQVSARGEYHLEQARVRALFAVSFSHWHSRIEAGLAEARQAHAELTQLGEMTAATLPLIASACYTLEIAPLLASVVAEAGTALNLSTRANNLVAAPYFRHLLGLAHVLQHDGDAPPRNDEASFTPLVRCTWHVTLALQSLLMDDLALLDQHSAQAYTSRAVLNGGYNLALATVLRAAALAQLAQSAAEVPRQRLRAEFMLCRSELSEWAEGAPENFQHLLVWLDAEHAWAQNDAWLAVTRFDQALHTLEQQQRPWHRAIITERAARFYLIHGMQRAGYQILRQASQLYRAWGASAKVQQLERRNAALQLAPALPGPEAERRSNTSANHLPMLALLRTSQALSSETNLTRLHLRISEQLSALTGADHVQLLLPDESGQGWNLATADSTETTLQSIDMAAANGLTPLSVFRYLMRTGTTLLVNDATRDDRFASDPYFIQAHPCCALLALPIMHHGALRAMLLFENRQRRGAFSSDRLEMLELIAGQLAVSLDNAMLYASLERKVSERTQALEQANRELAALSVTDALTGLANRRHFNQALDAAWVRALRPRSWLGAAMIDVDQFKLYNDHYGHQQGDACLKAVAHALARSVRHGIDLVARYGGEEFALILPGADPDETYLIAERARAAVAELCLPHLPSTHGVVTVSIGIASIIPEKIMAPAGLFGDADTALYQAKTQGRNRVVAIDSAQHRKS